MFFRKRNGGKAGDQKASGGQSRAVTRVKISRFLTRSIKKKFRNSKRHNISLKFLLRIFLFPQNPGSSKSRIPKHPSESVISGIPIGQNKINRLYKNRSSKYPGFCPGFIPFNCLTILRILILTEFGSDQAPTKRVYIYLIGYKTGLKPFYMVYTGLYLYIDQFIGLY